MSKTATVPATIEDMKTQARQRWNAWAVALADNGTLPPHRDLLDAGIVLGFGAPADRLEGDATVVAAVRARQLEIEAANAASAAWEKATGGHDALHARQAALQAELEQIDILSRGNQPNVYQRATAERALSLLRRQYPELLGGLFQ